MSFNDTERAMLLKMAKVIQSQKNKSLQKKKQPKNKKSTNGPQQKALNKEKLIKRNLKKANVRGLGEPKWVKKQTERDDELEVWDSIEKIVEEAAEDESNRESTMEQATTDDGDTNISLDLIPFSQVNVVPVVCQTDTESLTSLAAVYAFYALANGIFADTTTTLGGVTVGVPYAIAVTIAYDLYLAMNNIWSIFQNAPIAYIELRNAVLPTAVGGYSYTFETELVFLGVGGQYPGGFPVLIDDCSLGWIINTGPLFQLQTTIPALTEQGIISDGPTWVQDLWTRIYESTNNAAHRLISISTEVWTKNSVAVFAGNIPLSTNSDSLDRYSVFRHELKLNPREEWLAKLGLVKDDTNIVGRRFGTFSFLDFITTANFTDRIYRGVVGKSPKVIIRPKYIELERYVHAVVSAMASADIQYNELAGTSPINQPLFPRSMLYNIDQADFLYGVVQGIVRKFQVSNAVCINFPQSGFFPCAGASWITGAASNIDMGMTFINESLGSLQMIKKDLRQGRWSVIEYPVLATTGNFGTNFYDTVNLGTGNLAQVVAAMYPDTIVTAYAFKLVPTTLLPTTIEPINFSVCRTRGDSIPRAEAVYNSLLADMQGNIQVGNVVSGSHDKKTLMHYTQLCSYDDQQPTAYSRFYTAKMTTLCNGYTFTQKDVSYDLTRVMPTFYGTTISYSPIFHENNTQNYERGELVNSKDYMARVSAQHTHPIAGTGNETDIGDIAQVTQGLGGGFGGIIGTIGNIAMNLLSGLMPMEPAPKKEMFRCVNGRRVPLIIANSAKKIKFDKNY